jgi:hypothetical protein
VFTDSLGNTVTLQHASSIGALNDFVEGFISSEARAADVLQLADTDHSAIAQACCAALHMFAESRDAPANARPFLQRARAAAPASTPREQRFVAAVGAWVEGDIPQAIRLHEEQAREHPRDLVSLKLGQYHLFNLGNAPGMLRMALDAAPAAADVPYLHGMLAFAWEQCHLLREAETAAWQAIAMCRKEPWAHHALAHVMLTEGRIREGLDFMREVGSTWTGLNSFMVTHNRWHQALFALELAQHDEVLRLYDEAVWGVAKDYSQDQINAISLLARLELAGVDVGARWQDLGNYLAVRLADHVLPFLDMQYLYGLARAARPEAQALLHHIAAYAARAPEPVRATWQRVCLPASRGLMAHAQGNYAVAADELGQALPQLVAIGGSHAQRDLFSQIYLDALIRTGQLASAQHLLQQQLQGQPESERLKRQAGAVYTALGLSSVAATLL